MKNNYSSNLFDRNGQRKYMTSEERIRFYGIVSKLALHKKLFLLTLYHTGARMSEVLNLQSVQIDQVENMVVIECLKKRKKGIYRAVPLPEPLIKALANYIKSNSISGNVWTFSRSTASRYIKTITNEAEIFGVQACAKGLRHSYVVSAIEKNVPLNLISKWMGHSSIEVTAIYLNVMGKEERKFAKRMWT